MAMLLMVMQPMEMLLTAMLLMVMQMENPAAMLRIPPRPHPQICPPHLMGKGTKDVSSTAQDIAFVDCINV